MIIATQPFKPSRMIEAFKKAYDVQKESYINRVSTSDMSYTAAPNAIEKIGMAVRAGKVTVISELSLLILV